MYGETTGNPLALVMGDEVMKKQDQLRSKRMSTSTVLMTVLRPAANFRGEVF